MVNLIYVLNHRVSHTTQRLIRQFGSHKRLIIALVPKTPRSQLLLCFNVLKRAWLVQLLLARGCCVDIKDATGWTLLHLACISNDINLRYLLIVGANIDALDNYMKTPLLRAIAQSNIDCVRKLLTAGPNIEIESKNNPTALHMAYYWKKVEIVQLLLDAGAQVSSQKRQITTMLRNENPPHA